MTVSLLFFAILPPLLLARYTYGLNTYGRLDVGSCVRLMVFGGLSVIPILMVGTILNILTADASLLTYTLVFAASEEIFKLLVIKYLVYDKRIFAAPIDGIVYAVMASLGFALVENVQYVFNAQFDLIAGYYDATGGYTVALLRMFTTIPLHTLTAIIMGYFLGRAKFATDDEEKQLILKAIGSATLLHTAYNYTSLIIGELFFILILLGVGVYISKSLVQKGRFVDRMLEILSEDGIEAAAPKKPSGANPEYTEVVIGKTSDEVDVAPSFYEQAYNEIEAGKTKTDIWAMAYAKSSNEEDAKKKYITLRAMELAEEVNKIAAKSEQAEPSSKKGEV